MFLKNANHLTPSLISPYADGWMKKINYSTLRLTSRYAIGNILLKHLNHKTTHTIFVGGSSLVFFPESSEISEKAISRNPKAFVVRSRSSSLNPT